MNSLPRARGWAVVVLIALGAAVAQAFGRFTYGVLLPAIRNDLDHSNTVAGFLGTANVAAYLFGTLVVASLTSRVKLLTVLRCGFVFSLGGLALATVAPNAAVLSFALFLMGLGGAFIWIPSPAIAARAVGDHRRGVAVGLMGAGIGVGIVFSGQLARVLRERSGDGAWRDLYRVEVAIALVVVVAIVLFVRHREAPPSGARGTGIGVATLRQMPGWAALTGAYAAFGFCYILAVSFLTSRLEDDSAFSEGLASTMFTLVGLGSITGGVLLGLAADRIGERITLTIGFASFALALAGIMTGAVAAVAVGSVVVGVMFSGLASTITGYVVRTTTPATFGASFAATTFAFGIAQVSAPQIGGLVADLTGSFTMVFVLSMVFAVAGAIASSRLPAHDARV
ncbi:MAG: YbfB/YjiJ family MFS transporter [Ilumatobacter sp.]